MLRYLHQLEGAPCSRTAVHVRAPPLGRPVLYEPSHVNSKPIVREEVEALLEIEAEPSGVGAGVGPCNGDARRGWEAIVEQEGLRVERWVPDPQDDPSDLLIMRCVLTLRGVAPDVAVQQLYDISQRSKWDDNITSIKLEDDSPTFTSEDGLLNEVLHMQSQALLGVLPACKLVQWRALVRPAGGNVSVWLMRNADVHTGEDQTMHDTNVTDRYDDEKWGFGTSCSWMPSIRPTRLRGLVFGHVVRSLVPNCEAMGSRIFTYMQTPASSAVQLLASRLATDLAVKICANYRSACLAAAASATADAAATPRSTRSMQCCRERSATSCPPQFYDLAEHDAETSASVSPVKDIGDSASKAAACDFLGTVDTKLVPAAEIMASRVQRQPHQKDPFTDRPSMRVTVRMHRNSGSSAREVDTPCVPVPRPSPLSTLVAADGADFSPNQVCQAHSCDEDRSLEHRNRSRVLRQRSRERLQTSMATVARRLNDVMQERGSLQLEAVPEESTPLELQRSQSSSNEKNRLAARADTCADFTCATQVAEQAQPSRRRFTLPKHGHTPNEAFSPSVQIDETNNTRCMQSASLSPSSASSLSMFSVTPWKVSEGSETASMISTAASSSASNDTVGPSHSDTQRFENDVHRKGRHKSPREAAEVIDNQRGAPISPQCYARSAMPGASRGRHTLGKAASQVHAQPSATELMRFCFPQELCQIPQHVSAVSRATPRCQPFTMSAGPRRVDETNEA